MYSHALRNRNVGSRLLALRNAAQERAIPFNFQKTQISGPRDIPQSGEVLVRLCEARYSHVRARSATVELECQLQDIVGLPKPWQVAPLARRRTMVPLRAHGSPKSRFPESRVPKIENYHKKY